MRFQEINREKQKGRRHLQLEKATDIFNNLMALMSNMAAALNEYLLDYSTPYQNSLAAFYRLTTKLLTVIRQRI